MLCRLFDPNHVFPPVYATPLSVVSLMQLRLQKSYLRRAVVGTVGDQGEAVVKEGRGSLEVLVDGWQHRVAAVGVDREDLGGDLVRGEGGAVVRQVGQASDDEHEGALGDEHVVGLLDRWVRVGHIEELGVQHSLVDELVLLGSEGRGGRHGKCLTGQTRGGREELRDRARVCCPLVCRIRDSVKGLLPGSQNGACLGEAGEEPEENGGG
jgi:hypothetical protein